jgi:hypothetical protein
MVTILRNRTHAIRHITHINRQIEQNVGALVIAAETDSVCCGLTPGRHTALGRTLA